MTKASDNSFPSILITEGTEPSAPAAGKQRLYIDSTTHLLKLTNSSGVDTVVGAGVTASGCAANNSSDVAISTSGEGLIAMNTDVFDTDAYHFTSDANLTGTVSKTATSADLVGSGTSFTTELSVNQVIRIPGTTTEVGVVKLITDNTHLTLWQIMANTASGQTVARSSSYFAIPAGLGGKFVVGLTIRGSANVNGYMVARCLTITGGTNIGWVLAPHTWDSANSIAGYQGSVFATLPDGAFVELRGITGGSASNAKSGNAQWLSLARIGA